jgi:hypothetical protein
MSDTIPNPDDTDEIHATRHPASTEPAAAQPDPAPAPVTVHWWQRRLPLAITGAALLGGCVLGAGAGAIGASAVNDGHELGLVWGCFGCRSAPPATGICCASAWTPQPCC